MKSSGQMTLTLTDDLEKFVREQTRKGSFASNSEYVRTLVRERYLQERQRDERRSALSEAIAKGLRDADAGRTRPLDEAFAQLKAKFTADRSSNA
jgi:antitoxin ParD1/3/4